jgi:hypothetical protein
MNCYLSGIEINENNKSEEHIIPNALGGHIKNSYVLCHDSNQSLNTLIDIPFNSIFEPIYRRLTLKKDRASKTGIKGIHTQFKEEIVVKNNRCFPLKPLLDKENNILYVNSKNQGENYINYLKKKGEIKRDENIEIKMDLSGEVEFEFNLKNSIFPKGFAKIAAGFASLKGIERNNLKSIINLKTSSFSKIIPLIPYFPLNPIDLFIEKKRNRMTKYPLHTIVLKGCNEENILYCFIELFSTFKFIVIIDDKYDGRDIYHYYSYDLLNSKKIEANDYIASLDAKFYLSNNCLYNYSISQLNQMNHYANSKKDLIKLMNHKWFKELESFITFLNIENKFRTH